jgi:arylsulfatase
MISLKVHNNVSDLILFLLLIFIVSSCKKRVEQLPNIVLIFVDDQGYSDLGIYGARGFETPNIDRLAEEGMRFTSFYVSEAVCSASRASLLTGCYAQRIGIRGALNPISLTGLNPNETTIATALKKHGYATTIIGKWHLGSHPKFSPLNYGFDEYYGLLYSNDMWPVGFDGKPVEDGFLSLYPPLYLMEDTTRIKEIKTLDDQAMLTTFYTKKAIDFIERNQDRPFFLFLPHSMVHVPLGVSGKFKGQSEQGMFGDVMMEIDWSVGEIETKIQELGLSDNTIFIYTSDNGPWLNFGNHAGSALPLRGGKGNDREGGVRVPGIIKWPGKISPGRVSHELVTTLDILPTILEIVGDTVPERKIDGISVLPHLTSDTANLSRDIFYYYYEGALCGVRKGDWKLVLPHEFRSYEGVEPGMDGFPGPYSMGVAELALFNLKEDIGEKENIIDHHPDVVEQMLALAEKARETLGDKITATKGTEVREPGRVGRTGIIQHLAEGKPIHLTSPPDSSYYGEGAASLVDGIQASLEMSDGHWLGFRESGLDAVIDLGVPTKVHDIEVRFLQNQISWIFLPGNVKISVSSDWKHFEEIQYEQFENSLKDLNIKAYTISGQPDTTIRFVKIEATHIGQCPDWHPGKNERGWLFVDEIVVR